MFLNTEKRTKYVKENLPLKLFFFSRQLRLLRHDQIPNSHLPHLVHFLGLEIIKQEHPNYVPFNHIELFPICKSNIYLLYKSPGGNFFALIKTFPFKSSGDGNVSKFSSTCSW